MCAVPLSEHEQKLLHQLEQQLVDEDPRFASAMRGARGGPRGGRRLIFGAIGIATGLLLIIGAVAQQWPLLAVPGFLLMLAGASYALARSKLPSEPAATGSARPATGRAGAKNGNLFGRLEDRWDRRREEGDSRN